jgi:hypothetical protein
VPPVPLWSALSLDPRQPQHRPLRATDRDRAVVQGLLCEAYADGRLTAEELHERDAGVARSQTLGELPAFLADLLPPTPVPPAAPHGPAYGVWDATWHRPGARSRALQHWLQQRREALWTFGCASVVCWAVWWFMGLGVLGLTFPWPVLVMLVTGVRLLRVVLARHRVIADTTARLERLEAGAVRRPPGSPG